jgi:hypothetical protein
MDAIKKLIVTVLAACAVGATSACAGVSSTDYTQFSGHQKVLEQCLSDLDKSVRGSLGTPPHFDNLKEAATWTREHLPQDIRIALMNAGQSAIIEARPKTLDTLAHNSGEFIRLLHSVTAKELGQIAKYQRDGCDIVVPEKLSNVIDLVLNLSHGDMKKSFESLGLTDSYTIENAFLLMLTVDASGNKWDVKWFSKTHDARTSNITKRGSQ